MNKIAMITGAGSGIGRSLALTLTRQNIHVIAIGRRHTPLETLQASAPDLIDIISADVGSETDRLAIKKASAHHHTLDYLIHCAGTVTPLAPVNEITPADWHRAMATNLDGPFFLTQQCLPQLRGGGRVLHLSSAYAHFAVDHFGAYCVSKAALFMLYEQLKIELTTENIHVGSVMPGIVDTEIVDYFCSSASGHFPNKPFLQSLRRHQTILSPSLCAKFLSWLLLTVSDTAFSEKEWDIYESSHHSHWCAGETIPIPDFNADISIVSNNDKMDVDHHQSDDSTDSKK